MMRALVWSGFALERENSSRTGAMGWSDAMAEDMARTLLIRLRRDGLAKFGAFYGHTGEIPGFNTFMGYDPTTQTTIVTWATTAAAPDGRAPANTITQIVIGELGKAALVPSEGRP